MQASTSRITALVSGYYTVPKSKGV